MVVPIRILIGTTVVRIATVEFLVKIFSNRKFLISSWEKRYFLAFGIRAGTGRDFVPTYPSHYYPQVPITITFWSCPQLENIHHLNENNKWHQCLSFVCVCMVSVQNCRNICVIVYKNDLAICGGSLYKPVTLNIALFAWIFCFIYTWFYNKHSGKG